MRSRALKHTSFNRRLQVWMLVCVLMGAQLWAVWHSVAHAQTLQGVSVKASAEGRMAPWGHEDDGGWLCRALDHALAADLLVPDGKVEVATGAAALDHRAQPLGALRLYQSGYSARAPPLLTA